MAEFDRRELFSGALAGVAVATLAGTAHAETEPGETTSPGRRPWRVIDTNVNLFEWPFRRLPYDTIDALVGKLRSLGIAQAWAGSFEGLLHRDVAGVNFRLAEACRSVPGELLVPFGTVNPSLPDWEEDLRRCRQEHRMPGVRLHPNYHGYGLDDPRFARLLAMSAQRDMLVQLAVAMEDERTQHPLVRAADVDLAPLASVVKATPGVKVQLLNYRPRGEVFEQLAETPGVWFDVGRVEATDGVARLMRSGAGERAVFGTHAPFLVYESAMIRAYEAGLTENETRDLFERNARRLLPASKKKSENGGP